jgi:sarcosine oxidase
MPGDSPTAVVVGAGVFGSSLADALSGRGWEVTLVERYAPGNARSSSGDASRLLRQAHGRGNATDKWYASMAGEARSRWLAVSQEEDRELFSETGALWLAHTEDGWERRAEEVLRSVGAPVEMLSPTSVSDLVPSMQAKDLLFALHEPRAGVLRAAEAVRVLAQRAMRQGARLIRGTAVPAGDSVRVNGRTLSADRIVWACGAWLGTLFPTEAPIRATRQDVFYWDTPPTWSLTPAWADQDHGIYGLPDLDGQGAKILRHRPGRRVAADRFSREPDLSAAAAVSRYLRTRFRGLAPLRILRTHVMQYELTPTEDFLVGPVPGAERTWLMGGGSGHGFKHGPALAAHLTDVLEGKATLAQHLIRPQPEAPLTARSA